MTVVKIKFGSHLYGTNTPRSDLDYKSIHIPTARDIILQRVSNSITTGGKQKTEGERNLNTDIDDESYSLQKYLKLISEGQTVAIDMLFAPEPVVTTPLWEFIQTNKEKLLTKRSIAFVGYCRTQANKYGIKGSRVAAARSAMELFTIGLNKLGTQAKVRECFPSCSDMKIDEHTSIVTKETTLGNYETYFECCNRMVGFNNTIKEAANVFRRIYENYGNRAKLAELNEGIDWKALSHAVRVGKEALELLNTHHITFPLPYAEHILEIKQGKLPYTVVAEEIEQLLVNVEEASKISTLNPECDYEFIDYLVYDVYKNQIIKENNND